MGMVSSPATFFIPGTKGLTSEDRDYLKRFPEAESANVGAFTYGGLRTTYYHSPAGHHNKFIIGFSGANAQFPVDVEHIKYLNDHGATSICMALPRIGPKFMERAEKLMRAFLLDPMSPANIITAGSDAPRFLAVHSTSAPIILKLLGEKKTGDFIRSRYHGIEFLSPIFDVPIASRAHSYRTPEISFLGANLPSFQPISELFERYADRKPDVPLDQRRAVKAYLWLTAGSEGFVKTLSSFGMTMGHIREIQKYSWDVMKNFHPDHVKGLTTLVMAGDKDPCTCWKDSKAMAESMDVLGLKDNFYLVAGGGHDLIKNRPELLDIFLKKADEVTLREKMRKAAEYVYVPAARHIEKEELPPLPLRDRARLALQSGTRALYATASLF